MQNITITEKEFRQFQRLIHELAGIHMSSAKKALVGGRLMRRLRQLALKSYGEYFQLLVSGEQPDELQIAVNLLTTNETNFFREPKHFELLRQQLSVVSSSATYRAWSAACATGEEPYSIAMVLAECLGNASWEVVGSDISTRVLETAMGGHYSIARAKGIPRSYLQKYCLKGVGDQDGTFLVSKSIRDRVKLFQINLNNPLPHLGQFHVIFLRNVMIYFDMDTKRRVVNHLLPLLKPNGLFFVGHSETLSGVVEGLIQVKPSVYRKP